MMEGQGSTSNSFGENSSVDLATDLLLGIDQHSNDQSVHNEHDAANSTSQPTPGTENQNQSSHVAPLNADDDEGRRYENDEIVTNEPPVEQGVSSSGARRNTIDLNATTEDSSSDANEETGSIPFGLGTNQHSFVANSSTSLLMGAVEHGSRGDISPDGVRLSAKRRAEEVPGLLSIGNSSSQNAQGPNSEERAVTAEANINSNLNLPSGSNNQPNNTNASDIVHYETIYEDGVMVINHRPSRDTTERALVMHQPSPEAGNGHGAGTGIGVPLQQASNGAGVSLNYQRNIRPRISESSTPADFSWNSWHAHAPAAYFQYGRVDEEAEAVPPLSVAPPAEAPIHVPAVHQTRLFAQSITAPAPTHPVNLGVHTLQQEENIRNGPINVMLPSQPQRADYSNMLGNMNYAYPAIINSAGPLARFQPNPTFPAVPVWNPFANRVEYPNHRTDMVNRFGMSNHYTYMPVLAPSPVVRHMQTEIGGRFPRPNFMPALSGPQGQAPFPGPQGQATLPGPQGQAAFPGPQGQATLPGPQGQAAFPGPQGQAALPGPQRQAAYEQALASNPLIVRSISSAEWRQRLIEEIDTALALVHNGDAGIRDFLTGGNYQSNFIDLSDDEDDDDDNNHNHDNMRLDLDNMTYEALVALQDEIGPGRSGITEDHILPHLEVQKYQPNQAGFPDQDEICCICQEQYLAEEDITKLDCKHYYHVKCITNWLMRKNSCPICKSIGLTALVITV